MTTTTCAPAAATATSAATARSGRSRRHRALDPIVVLRGPAGVGKTAVRELLAPILDAASLGPDDFDGGWQALVRHLDRDRRAVVECVRIHSALRRRIEWRGATVIDLTASEEVRRARLELRGESETTIATLLGTDENTYDEDITTDLELATDRLTPTAIAGLAAHHLGRGGR